MRILLFSLFVGLLSFGPLAAQDTLLLLNGKEIPGRISNDKGIDILFEVERSGGGTKILQYERTEIFSYSKAGMPDSILYQKDPLLGFDLEREDMRYYMHGQSDASNHRTIYNDIGGFAFGAGTTFFLNGGAVPFLSPVAYSLAMQIPIIKVQEEAISDKRNTVSPYYLEGYDRTARSRKFVRGFLSSLAGVFVASGILLVAE